MFHASKRDKVLISLHINNFWYNWMMFDWILCVLRKLDVCTGDEIISRSSINLQHFLMELQIVCFLRGVLSSARTKRNLCLWPPDTLATPSNLSRFLFFRASFFLLSPTRFQLALDYKERSATVPTIAPSSSPRLSRGGRSTVLTRVRAQEIFSLRPRIIMCRKRAVL